MESRRNACTPFINRGTSGNVRSHRQFVRVIFFHHLFFSENHPISIWLSPHYNTNGWLRKSPRPTATTAVKAKTSGTKPCRRYQWQRIVPGLGRTTKTNHRYVTSTSTLLKLNSLISIYQFHCVHCVDWIVYVNKDNWIILQATLSPAVWNSFKSRRHRFYFNRIAKKWNSYQMKSPVTFDWIRLKRFFFHAFSNL